MYIMGLAIVVALVGIAALFAYATVNDYRSRTLPAPWPPESFIDRLSCWFNQYARVQRSSLIAALMCVFGLGLLTGWFYTSLQALTR